MARVTSFTYRSARSGTRLVGLVLVVAVETLPLHLWLAARHPLAAWMLTLSNVGTLVWMVAGYRAMGRGAVRLAGATLDLQIGRRLAASLPVSAIAAAMRPTWRDLPEPGTPAAAQYLNLMGASTPNVLLILVAPTVVRLPGGWRRTARQLGLCLDAPDDFLAALAQTSSPMVSRAGGLTSG